jgi:hypothetical protein
MLAIGLNFRISLRQGRSMADKPDLPTPAQSCCCREIDSTKVRLEGYRQPYALAIYCPNCLDTRTRRGFIVVGSPRKFSLPQVPQFECFAKSLESTDSGSLLLSTWRC